MQKVKVEVPAPLATLDLILAIMLMMGLEATALVAMWAAVLFSFVVFGDSTI